MGSSNRDPIKVTKKEKKKKVGHSRVLIKKKNKFRVEISRNQVGNCYTDESHGRMKLI